MLNRDWYIPGISRPIKPIIPEPPNGQIGICLYSIDWKHCEHFNICCNCGMYLFWRERFNRLTY